MTTDNWQQFKDIFQTALELPPAKRGAYLYKACAEPSARAELEALLRCYDKAPAGKSSESEAQHSRVSTMVAEDPLVESFLDHYQIVAKVGVRGPATRYLARRLNDPDLKQVVVTILNTKTNGTDFLRSFRRERHALIAIRHPGIVSFFDTGVTKDSCPYFVSDSIEGTSLNEYCDSQKLDSRGRVELFLAVSDAVQHAHQHFLSHGDLNPANILVAKDGIPKLRDLGVAGLVNQEIRVQGSGIGESDLEYISPEQACGEPSTAADDVYALGIVLYQLLTGQLPGIKSAMKDDFLPPVVDVVLPSRAVDDGGRDEKKKAVRKFLAGDMDSVILKAIQKNPLRRYGSVEQFSTDIRRSLEGRTVGARKATVLYRADKFVRRHAFAVTSVLVLGMMMGAALVAMFDGWMR
jgi:serine/threonine protein kinase